MQHIQLYIRIFYHAAASIIENSTCYYICLVLLLFISFVPLFFLGFGGTAVHCSPGGCRARLHRNGVEVEWNRSVCVNVGRGTWHVTATRLLHTCAVSAQMCCVSCVFPFSHTAVCCCAVVRHAVFRG